MDKQIRAIDLSAELVASLKGFTNISATALSQSGQMILTNTR